MTRFVEKHGEGNYHHHHHSRKSPLESVPPKPPNNANKAPGFFHNKIVVRLARGVPQCARVGLGPRPMHVLYEGCATPRAPSFPPVPRRRLSLCVNRAHTKRRHTPRAPLSAPAPFSRPKGAPSVLRTKGWPAQGFKTEFFIRSTGKRPSYRCPLSEVSALHITCVHIYIYKLYVRRKRRMAPFRHRHCANRFPFQGY